MASNHLIWEDRKAEAGQASGHYFHQDLLVAREVFRRNPRRHLDVGSSIYGFVSHVATFREIEVLDVRPLTSTAAGIHFIQQDITQVADDFEACCDSLSCLHALEHFGLGRYGDPLDPDGWLRGLDGLTRMLEPDGHLYLSVPTGSVQRLEFNAHRVFSLPYLRDVLCRDYEIQRLAFVLDNGSLLQDLDPWSAEAETGFDSEYGCSIWFLRKARDV